MPQSSKKLDPKKISIGSRLNQTIVVTAKVIALGAGRSGIGMMEITWTIIDIWKSELQNEQAFHLTTLREDSVAQRKREKGGYNIISGVERIDAIQELMMIMVVLVVMAYNEEPEHSLGLSYVTMMLNDPLLTALSC